jgi:hypothetical protein
LRNREQYCKKLDDNKTPVKKVSEYCPLTCEVCVAPPTVAPICKDDATYKFQNSNKTCQKISSYRNLDRWCRKNDKKKVPRKPVSFYCPETCGKC